MFWGYRVKAVDSFMMEDYCVIVTASNDGLIKMWKLHLKEVRLMPSSHHTTLESVTRRAVRTARLLTVIGRLGCSHFSKDPIKVLLCCSRCAASFHFLILYQRPRLLSLAVALSTSLRPDWIASKFNIQVCICDPAGASTRLQSVAEQISGSPRFEGVGIMAITDT